MVAGKHQQKMTPKEVASQFRDCGGISLGDTPELARGRCWELSLAFSWYAKGLGVNAVMLNCCRRSTDNVPVAHYVVWFPDHEIAVDWTARQFWPEMPHPALLNRSDLESLWFVEYPPPPKPEPPANHILREDKDPRTHTRRA